jgi:hypothetical protein
MFGFPGVPGGKSILRKISPLVAVDRRFRTKMTAPTMQHMNMLRSENWTECFFTACPQRLAGRLISTNGDANPVAASELPCQKPVIGNSGSAFCSAVFILSAIAKTQVSAVNQFRELARTPIS